MLPPGEWQWPSGICLKRWKTGGEGGTGIPNSERAFPQSKSDYPSTQGRPDALAGDGNAAALQHIRSRYRLLAGVFAAIERPQERDRLNLTRMATSGDVLEVGVGTGRGLPFYDQARSVTAIDLSPHMLEKASQQLPRCQRPVKLLEMDVQALAFPDDSFDTVVCSYVFCTVPDPSLGLAQIRRVLKPSGAAILLEHVRGEGWLGPVTDAMAPVFRWAAGCNPNRDTVASIKAAGFRLISVQTLRPSVVKLILASPNKPFTAPSASGPFSVV